VTTTRWREKRRKAREDISQLWNMCLWKRNKKERQVRAQEESVDVDDFDGAHSFRVK
jgi:hypothetical protein